MPIALLFLLMTLNLIMALVLPFFDKSSPQFDLTISLYLTVYSVHILCLAVTSLLCRLDFSLTERHMTFDVWRLHYLH